MKCYACGEILADDARFCGFCGADQSKRSREEIACSHCGQPMAAEDRFCGCCGHSQEQIPKMVSAELLETQLPELVAEQPAAQERPAEESVMADVPVQEAVGEETIAENVSQQEITADEVLAQENETAVPPKAAQTLPPPSAYAQQSPYQRPGSYTQPNPYQPAYQPQQNVQVNLHTAPPAQPAYQPVQPPALKLNCSRGLLKMLLLGLLTCGIYPLVVYAQISMEINMVASRYDGRRTIHFLWVPLLASLTLGIYPFVWFHGLCDRMGGELRHRQIDYRFGAACFWWWNLVYGFAGVLVTGIAVYVLQAVVGMEEILVGLIGIVLILASMAGPLVFVHKLMKAMNLLNADYNRRG